MNAPLMLPTILTAGGRYFPLLAPTPADIHIEDIAHALSNLCRFTGHVREFYSVAQHSVMVSQIVPPEDALAALLHDASEAYITDISKPLKPHLHGYAEIETRIMEAVLAAFGLPTCLPASVKRADLILLATEKRDLMPAHGDDWDLIRDIPRLQEEIVPLPPRAARARFLDRFHQLYRRAS
jgi:5'-deoxynucleotidase YfbR-like HD superfamily hydrolase